MDPDPTPDPTPLFIDFKDGKKTFFRHIFSFNLPTDILFCVAAKTTPVIRARLMNES
jgi:hypothetical protein